MLDTDWLSGCGHVLICVLCFWLLIYFAGVTIPFCSSLFSFSAAAPGMIVLQGSLIPCRITDAQICHPLSRVFLSLFLCRIFVFQVIIFSTGFFRFVFQVKQISLYFSHSRLRGWQEFVLHEYKSVGIFKISFRSCFACFSMFLHLVR